VTISVSNALSVVNHYRPTCAVRAKAATKMSFQVSPENSWWHLQM